MTCMATCGGGSIVLFGFAWKPESMPPSSAWHGESKVDCVAVWFWLRKVKMTVSPMAAFSSWGSKTRPCGPPTVTVCVAAGAATVSVGCAGGGGGGASGWPVTTGGGGVAWASPPTVCVTVTVEAVPTTVVAAPPPRLTQRKLISVLLGLCSPIRRASSLRWCSSALTFSIMPLILS